MKKVVLIAFAFLCAAGALLPATAEARVFVSAGFGGYGYGGYPYGYPYPAYYYPYYVAPPPVVYSVPPAPVYAEPPPQVVYQQQAPAGYQQAPAPVSQTSPTFIDDQGRTCRQYQATTPGGAPGKACLMPDGTWRAVP